MDLLAAERKRIKIRRSTVGIVNAATNDGAQRNEAARIPVNAAGIKREERSRTIDAWQRGWENTNKPAWTRKLLPDIRRWTNATVEPTYALTQALSGHGCFKKYLYSKKRALTPYCVYCVTVEDDAAHTLFECPRWDNLRLEVGQFCGGRNPVPEDVQDLLCGPVLPNGLTEERKSELLQASARATLAFVQMVNTIIDTKESEERQLQAQNRAQPRRVHF